MKLNEEQIGDELLVDVIEEVLANSISSREVLILLSIRERLKTVYNYEIGYSALFKWFSRLELEKEPTYGDLFSLVAAEFELIES